MSHHEAALHCDAVSCLRCAIVVIIIIMYDYYYEV